MLIDLTDYGFNITSFSRPYETLPADTNLLNSDQIIPNNPLQVDSYYFPNMGIYSYKYLCIPMEKWLNDSIFPFETIHDIHEYLSIFNFDKLKIEERYKLDMSKFFDNRMYAATLDIDEEMLLYIKIKFGNIFEENNYA